MTALVALLVGYLVGSIPTAEWIARRSGIELRTSGSGNPGANNARRLGGWRLGVSVLAVEMAKGVAAVIIAGAVGGMVLGAIGAVAGNVFNPWYRFSGGQGLGITAGALSVAWPLGLAIALFTLAVTLKVSGTTRIATLAALLALLLVSPVADPLPWGISDGHFGLAVGLAAIVGIRQLELIVTTPDRPTYR